MKDITIKTSTINRELLWMISCFIVAFLINVYAVVKFDRPAIELLSQLGFVVAIAVGLYILSGIPRAIVCLVRYLFSR